MASNGTKLSFAFAPPPTTTASSSSSSSSAKKAGGGNPLQGATSTSSSSSTSAAPKSNLELLMARSKGNANSNGSTSASNGSNGQSSKSTTSTSKPKVSRPLLFDDHEEDEDQGADSVAAAGPSKPKLSNSSKKPQAPVGQTNLLSRSERRAKEAAEAIDQSIFDYDTHYDKMKSAERAIEEAKKQDAAERKPKHMEGFLASAQTRRLDRLRAEEKALAREREKEGDEFDDKEKFVTEGYKKQMEEVRKAEEEEKIREEAMRKSKSGPGLTSFYKTMLDTDEAKHAAAVAATSGPSSVSNQGPSLAIRPPTASGPQREEESRNIYDDEEEYDPLLAREAKTSNINAGSTSGTGSGTDDPTGKKKDVEINDNGEIVDKRSLLKAGLNIMKKPKSALPNSLLTSQRSSSATADGEGPYKSRAVGTAASYGERMERERKRLADQMRAESERKKAQEEERLRKEEDEAKKRKEGDNGEAERKRNEARERYLARKRQREEEEVKNGGAKKVKEDE
ncbi:hypothetical protein IAT40_001162 [Kwoniella sp. CBS 6097]